MLTLLYRLEWRKVPQRIDRLTSLSTDWRQLTLPIPEYSVDSSISLLLSDKVMRETEIHATLLIPCVRRSTYPSRRHRLSSVHRRSSSSDRVLAVEVRPPVSAAGGTDATERVRPSINKHHRHHHSLLNTIIIFILLFYHVERLLSIYCQYIKVKQKYKQAVTNSSANTIQWMQTYYTHAT